MRKLITLICLLGSLGCFAQWSKQIVLAQDPNVFNLFEEVAMTERGIARYIVLDALAAQVNEEVCTFGDIALTFYPELDYFNAVIGNDDASGDGHKQILQGKVWLDGNDMGEDTKRYLGTVVIDSSPQEECREFTFYEYDPRTQTLKSIPSLIKLPYPDDELQYDIKSDGIIIVKRWGEIKYHLVWTGSGFHAAN